MESLQTLSVKSLFDNYTWDSKSLISIKDKIDDLILVTKSNELRDFYVLNDVTNEFSERLAASTIIINKPSEETSNILTVTCDNAEYLIYNNKYSSHTNHRMEITIGDNGRAFNFNRDDAYPIHLNQISTRDIHKYLWNCNHYEVPEEILNFGFFLWKYYNKLFWSGYFKDDDNEDDQVIIIFSS